MRSYTLAVLGWPVGHSRSPRLHRYWLQQAGLLGTYDALPIQPASLGTALREIVFGFDGFNVTIPHKEAIIPFLDDVTAEVAQVGACNTVVIKNKKLFGHNTDVLGYWRGLNEQCPSILERKDSLVAIIGAGGAAKAVVAALKKQEFKNFCFFVRNVDAAREIIKHFGLYGARILNLTRGIFSLSDEVGLVVNTTPLGMTGMPVLDFSLERLRGRPIVSDCVYNPIQTEFLKDAQRLGLIAVDGIGMFLYQAAAAFTLWTGITPSIDAKALRLARGDE
ncbi:MAG: shikimate dehydrogenase [Holosporales bacterium]|jgi:shikimate dehydrogenase